jgi:hypothetical protein
MNAIDKTTLRPWHIQSPTEGPLKGTFFIDSTSICAEREEDDSHECVALTVQSRKAVDGTSFHNAELIVRAVNSYDDLVDTCMRLSGLLKEAIADLREEKRFGTASIYEVGHERAEALLQKVLARGEEQ